jgi:UDP-N-acetyl-D-galactosamine dehydrogenase
MNLIGKTLAIIGLGYVGLPLAVEFSKSRNVIGFDINLKRINSLKNGIDSTLEVSQDDLKAANNLIYSSEPSDLRSAQVFIVTVPTPINQANQPDITILLSASELVGKALKKGDFVIYESTVYPGCTEDECVPVLERISGLKFNVDFYVGYSPERINPGDKVHRLTNIKKITSGSTPDAALAIDRLYKEIVLAGTHPASSIKVAEAAKVIENTQRDLNIALINELALIFNKMNIDTEAVLQAAGSKWNFLPFRPGLVGGHCIGVDPYYLTYKAEVIGYHPEVILAGRRVNDGMSKFVASNLIKKMASKGIVIKKSRVLIMGLTFKENCPDIRNTKVIDVSHELSEYGCYVDIYDPWVDPTEALKEYEVEMLPNLDQVTYDAILIAVAHDVFKIMEPAEVARLRKPLSIVYDLKYVLSPELSDIRL